MIWNSPNEVKLGLCNATSVYKTTFDNLLDFHWKNFDFRSDDNNQKTHKFYRYKFSSNGYVHTNLSHEFYRRILAVGKCHDLVHLLPLPSLLCVIFFSFPRTSSLK